MDNQTFAPDNSLLLEDIKRIESTSLSAKEKHHLRLLAHCLACFKMIAKDPSKGPFPENTLREEWCLRQVNLAKEKDFIVVFLDQLESAASQLEAIANSFNMSPLELTIDELIRGIS